MTRRRASADLTAADFIFYSWLAFLLVLGYLVVSAWDYEDLRREECAQRGQHYNPSEDTCYAPPKES